MSTLTIPVGSTWAYGWPISNSTGGPTDLTGWSARAQIRANKWMWDSLPVLFSWSSVGSNPNITLSNSTVVLYVSPVDSKLWRWWSGVLQVEITDSLFRVARVDEFDIKLSPEVIW